VGGLQTMDEDRKLRAGEDLFAWLMLGFSGFVLIQAYLISGFSSVDAPGTFPMGAAAVMVAASLSVLLKNRRLKAGQPITFKAELNRAAAAVLPRVFMVYCAIIVGYMLLIKPLHFFPASFAFLLISMVYLKGTGWFRSLMIATVMLGSIYIVFQYFFRVVLP
jgi:putative tricarboxylic transport membrane protein